MTKLKMLQPRLATLDPFKNVKMLNTTKKPWLKLEDIKTARWTKAKNGRLLPLNSAAWYKLRASVLAGEPLCRMCSAQGLTVVATDLDHINNNPADNDPLNLAPLCHMHHGMKTARDMGGNVRMGCASDGTPLDHLHHWNMPAKPLVMPLVRAVVERSPATNDHEPYGLPCFNANPVSVA